MFIAYFAQSIILIWTPFTTMCHFSVTCLKPLLNDYNMAFVSGVSETSSHLHKVCMMIDGLRIPPGIVLFSPPHE